MNFTTCNDDVFDAFVSTADHNVGYTEVIGKLLDKGLRVLLYAGDADYICNWYGVEAVSLEIPWTGKQSFNKAGYTDFLVEEESYGQVRQAGNLSFLRVWNSGHEVPYYQPKASLEMFRRMIQHREMADGVRNVTNYTVTEGTFLAEPVYGQDPGPGYYNEWSDSEYTNSSDDDIPFWKGCKEVLRSIWRKVVGIWRRVDSWLVY